MTRRHYAHLLSGTAERRSSRLRTREARLKLAPRHEPYWYDIERGRSIGYDSGRKGGSSAQIASHLPEESGGTKIP